MVYYLKLLVLWDVYGECKNYNVLSGHKNAVLEVKWTSNDKHILSCSADKTAAQWDANKGVRIRKFVGHSGVVNCLSVSQTNPCLFATGSDDKNVLIWDSRNKRHINKIRHPYQVTSLCMSADGKNIFTGGIDNIIRYYIINNII